MKTQFNVERVICPMFRYPLNRLRLAGRHLISHARNGRLLPFTFCKERSDRSDTMHKQMIVYHELNLN